MAENNEFVYDPEDEKDNSGKYRLPFALCKKAGIPIQDWWTPRDAWNALKNGTSLDVSEEYKDYYRKLKQKQSKESYDRNKKRNAVKKAQLDNPLHTPDKNYTHKDGAVAGARKGEPMTFEQADSGHCNPFYQDNIKGKTIGYQTNCATCVATYIARRQGYDVRALPNLNNLSVANLSHNTMLAYIDKSTGKHPSAVDGVGKRYGEKNRGIFGTHCAGRQDLHLAMVVGKSIVRTYHCG